MFKHRRNWISKALVSLAAFATAAGCASVGERSYVEQQPRTEVVRTVTSFSNSLRCMDDMFARHGVHDIPITSVGVADPTGKVRAGHRDMLITAVATMSERSGAFRYVDWEYDNKEIQILWQRLRDENKARFEAEYADPIYTIRGAVTGFDQNVAADQAGGGAAFQSGEYTGDAVIDVSNSASVMSLDLNIASTRTRAILPGMSSNNSLAIDRRGAALAGSLSNNNFGLTFDFESTRAEGVAAGVRTLIELGAIETLGKLTRVPYWQCLEIASTEPAVIREMHGWWKDMSENERQRFTERALIANGYMQGQANNHPDAESRRAISRFQADNDLVVTGRVNFELYRSLVGSDRPLALGPPETFVAKDEAPDAAADQIPVRQPVEIELFTDRGTQPVYGAMESLRASVRLSGSAYVACYYQEAGGNVMRVFPNRSQPGGYLTAGDITTFPSYDAEFEIYLERPGATDEVMCVASDREVSSHLPEELRVRDLVPMQVESLDELSRLFQDIDYTGLSEARMPIRVVGM